MLFLQVHYGFILKTTYDDSYNGARLMASGIATREDGVIDGRFYFHLGDALTRLGRSQEAQQVIGLFIYLFLLPIPPIPGLLLNQITDTESL